MVTKVSSILVDTDYVSVKAYGATGDGVTNDTAAIQAALNASTKIYFPAGSYLISAQLNVKPLQSIRGFIGQSIINLTGNHAGFMVDGRPSISSQEDMDVVIDGVSFTGTGKGASFNAGNSNQHGVYLSYAYNCRVTNCDGRNLGGSLVATANTRIEPSGSVYVEGNTITDCRAYSCNAGFMSLVRGEYTNVSGCSFVSGNVGAWIRGGNNTLSGCNLSINVTGVYLADGDNDAHGVVIGCQINHNSSYGIYVEDSVVLGHRFTGCDIYSSAIYLGACKYITIESSDISTSSWTFNGTTKCWIRNNTFTVARSSISYTHTNSEVLFENNKNIVDDDAGAATDKYLGGFLRATRTTSAQSVSAASNAIVVWNTSSINAVSNNASYTGNNWLDTSTGHITVKGLHSGPTLFTGNIKAEILSDYTGLMLSLEINSVHKIYLPAVDQLVSGSTYRRVFCINTQLILNKNDVVRFRLINGSVSNAASILTSESLLEINGL